MFLKETAKEIIKKGNYMFRFSTRHMRVLPDFLIIGGQKCGTSSFYRNLVKHPSIVPAFDKEIYFSMVNFTKGLTGIEHIFHYYPISIMLQKYAGKISHRRGYSRLYFSSACPQKSFGGAPTCQNNSSSQKPR